MLYAKIVDNAVSKYPYSINDLKKDNPNISFPKKTMSLEHIRSNYGVVEVTEVGLPSSDTHNIEEGDPTKVDGSWTQTWNQTQKTTDELNERVKAIRLSHYGSPEQQLEFITENGLEAWQTKVAEIKPQNPKT